MSLWWLFSLHLVIHFYIKNTYVHTHKTQYSDALKLWRQQPQYCWLRTWYLFCWDSTKWGQAFQLAATILCLILAPWPHGFQSAPYPPQCTHTRGRSPHGPRALHGSFRHTQPFQNRGSSSLVLQTCNWDHGSAAKFQPKNEQVTSTGLWLTPGPGSLCSPTQLWAGELVCVRGRRGMSMHVKATAWPALPLLPRSRPFSSVSTLNSIFWPHFAECD